MSAFASISRWADSASRRLMAEPLSAQTEREVVPLRLRSSGLGSSRSTLKTAVGLVSILITTALHAATAPAPTGGLQQSFTSGNVKGTLFIPGDAVPRFGFVPIRVAVDNREPRELRWDAKFFQSSFSNSGVSTASQTTTTLTVPAGRSGERWMFVPTADSGPGRGSGSGAWGNFAVNLDGSGISETNLNFNVGRSGASMPAWAVSASLESVVRSRLVGLKTDVPQPGGYRAGRAPLPPTTGVRPLLRTAPNLFSFDPSQSFGEWRIWSPFARVLLRVDEYTSLPPANRAALRDWVALGGWLYLVPDDVRGLRIERLGAGAILTLTRPITVDDRHDNDGLFVNGAVLSLTPAIPYDLAMPKTGMVKKVSPARIVGDWLVYFFVGFAVLVAPVNLFAIATVKRRHWLFMTLPGISLAAVGVLVTAIYLQDGVGGEGARRSIVALLPGDHRAVVFQEQVSRTGLLFGTRFPLADDTICAAVEVEDAASMPGRALEYQRSDGRASGDWFRGRARQAQHLRRLTPTRARIEQVGATPDGAPIVQSSVGATLRNFAYVDRAGVAWQVDTLPPGTRVTLLRAEREAGLTKPLQVFRADAGSDAFQNLINVTVQEKHQGRFAALAENSELAPLPTLASINWKDSAVLITGMVEGAGAAPGKATP